ncbi:uncharacterized protein K02A2.6 [Trichonephila clavipes]|nr:uncharacterized protein K02A2.6 [Trichonephila clavipes]
MHRYQPCKENCRFISSKCNFCGKIGHIKQACFASKKANAKSVKQKQVTLLNEVEDRNRIPLYETKIQDKLRRDNFEFRDRKFDVGDRVAVRVYRAANTRWKFGTIVNQDGVLHYIIDVKERNPLHKVLDANAIGRSEPSGYTCDRTQPMPTGDASLAKVKGLAIVAKFSPLMHQRFPSSEVRENNSNIQHAETAEDISKDLNKELGSSSVQGVPSTDVAVPDLSQSSAKETDSETRSPPVPDRPFPRRSGRIRRPPERLVL